MRIYEDVVYRPQDMIWRPEGFQIRRFSVRPEWPVVGSAEDEPETGDAALCRAALHRPIVSLAEEEPDAGNVALCQAALHRPVVNPAEEKDDPDARDAALCQAALYSPIAGSTEVEDSLGQGEADPHRAVLLRPWTPDSDPEIEDLLRDTTESCNSPVCSPTPERPLTPRAAKITVEAANKQVVNARAVVERLLPWLKDGISSSESSNTRTPSPDIELGDIFEFEEAAQIDLEPKQLNEIF